MYGLKKRTIFYLLFLFFTAINLFPQDELFQRGSIPVELLRPRREESPRYPVDVVIGPIGQGDVARDAYDFAVKTAAALLAGTKDAPVLSSVNRAFLENCLSALDVINPRAYRIGSGRTEPDGSVSFLVRFSGREQGITGELFIRQEQEKVKVPEAAAVIEPVEEKPVTASPVSDNSDAEDSTESSGENFGEDSENTYLQDAENTVEYQEIKQPEIIPVVPGRIIWVFEDLILEEPRSRQDENSEDRKRFDFSPYERLY